jgi:hypothetical protein
VGPDPTETNCREKGRGRKHDLEEGGVAIYGGVQARNRPQKTYVWIGRKSRWKRRERPRRGDPTGRPYGIPRTTKNGPRLYPRPA